MPNEPIVREDQLERSDSFIETLFDFSFTTFVSETVVKVLYALAIVLAAVSALGIIVSGFASGFGAGIFALVFAPILFIVWVLLARIMLEVFIVIFRIADFLRANERNTRE